MPIKKKVKYRKLKKGPKAKRSKVAGLKCGSNKEARFVKECIRYKRLMPIKAKRIETPIGHYTPDFEYPTEYIEIKSLHTFLVCVGVKTYRNTGTPSSLQWDKIQWVAKAKKPVRIIVYLSRRESIPSTLYNATNVTIEFKGGYVKKK